MGYGLKGFIARQMSVGIVESFKKIYVAHNKRKRPFVSLRSGDLFCQRFLKILLSIKTCQPVMYGLIFRDFFIMFYFYAVFPKKKKGRYE